MGSRVAIGIVVYNPGKNLLERLQRCINAGYSFYIFDNSPESSSFREYARSSANIRYFTCGKNAGLGYGISTVCAHAYYDGYLALMFFDQDTGFSTETLDFINDFFEANVGLQSDYSAILFNSRSVDAHRDRMDVELKEVVLAINSGSLYILENVRTINWHDLGYFVDGVDYKFCLDSARNSLKIVECSWTPGFDHVTEQDGTVYNLFGKECRLRAYPLRRVSDTVLSSLKLIGSALSSFKFGFAGKVTRLFIIYLLAQILARGVDFVWRKEDV